jgi:uncharacterized protein (UPF0261 family)
VPTGGLSIPSVPDGVFWNPDADAGFLAELRHRLRPDILIHTRDCHINAPEFARDVVAEFLSLVGAVRGAEAPRLR